VLTVKNASGAVIVNIFARGSAVVFPDAFGWASVKTLESWWVDYGDVIPTRTTSDDPTYIITFAGVDLTGKISVGMRLRWVQNSTVRYAIVTAISYSTNTTLTLYGGTDYNVETTPTYPISNFAYSGAKTPLGFPANPEKWTVEVTDTANRSQSSPVVNTWYNLGSVSINIPLGLWGVGYSVKANASHGSVGTTQFNVTLSTAPTTNSNPEFARGFADANASAITMSLGAENLMSLSVKDTYYFNTQGQVRVYTSINNYNASATLTIKAVCAYL
jgi:hypothetical protein